MTTYEKIFDRLNQESIRYIVVGGVAVILHGYGRTTFDLDILLALDEENIQKMDKVMKEMGYYPRIPVEFKDLKNRENVKKLVDEKNMKAYTFLGSQMNLIEVDVLAEESLEFEKFDQTKTMIDSNGIQIPVISIDELIRMKENAGRPKDLEVIDSLKDLKKLE